VQATTRQVKPGECSSVESRILVHDWAPGFAHLSPLPDLIRGLVVDMQPVQNEDGDWVIPATKRPDGSWRKEVVTRAGYMVRYDSL
jgi:hypothetical protein